MIDLSKLVRPLVWQGGFAETPFGTLLVDIWSDRSWRGGKEYRAGDYVQNAQGDEEADYTAKLLAAIDTEALGELVEAVTDATKHINAEGEGTVLIVHMKRLVTALALLKGPTDE